VLFEFCWQESNHEFFSDKICLISLIPGNSPVNYYRLKTLQDLIWDKMYRRSLSI